MAKKSEGLIRATVTATMRVNGERFVLRIHGGEQSPMGVLDNWQVKDALVSE